MELKFDLPSGVSISYFSKPWEEFRKISSGLWIQLYIHLNPENAKEEDTSLNPQLCNFCLAWSIHT